MAVFIKETQSIKDAVSLINRMDQNKYSRCVSRILQKLHLKGERTFSEEEEEKLQVALSLDKAALGLVLETSAFILEQAVYNGLKPAALRQQLEAVGLTPERAEAVSQAWASAGPDLLEKHRQGIFTPRKLERVAWQLNLQLSQSSQTKLKTPHAVLELGLNSETSEGAEKVFVKFSHQELLEFYNKLETVQTQLDSLT